jgi:hypothetical protein
VEASEPEHAHPPTAEKRRIARPQASLNTVRPIRIQSACIARPPSSQAVDRSPTSASIGKKNAHWNGRNAATVWAQSGMSGSGTSRPESSSSLVMKRSNTAQVGSRHSGDTGFLAASDLLLRFLAHGLGCGGHQPR